MKRLLVLAVVSLLATPVQAGENQRFELVIGQSAVDGEGVNGATLDSDADAYAARFMQDFGESGYFAGGMNLERIELTDVDGGAWAVDALARLQRRSGRIRAYLAGGLGGIFADATAVPVPVELQTEEGTVEGETMESVQEVGLRVSGLAGVQIYFSEAQRVGVGVEYAYARNLDDGLIAEDDRGARVFLILPATGEEQ